MSDTDLAFMATAELRARIASKQLSPVEVTRLYLRRIEALDTQLNAYLTVTEDLALKMARDAEQAVMDGKPLGPLHGVPLSIKDLEVTKGIRTTLGCLIFEDTVPELDTIVVERVRQAGAVLLGKTNTPEFGLLGTTENRLGDACRNPWNRERTSGGSSGGAGAAVAGLPGAAAQATEGAGRVADNGVQLLGGAGYVQDHPVEKWLRDTKTLALFAAPAEGHLETIAAAELGQAMDVPVHPRLQAPVT